MAQSSLSICIVLGLLAFVQCQNFDDDVWRSEFDNDRRFPVNRPREDIAQGCQSKVMDIFFILDSSTSIYVLDYRQELTFVQDVVRRFDVSQTDTRVGVLTFSDDTTMGARLNQYWSKNEVVQAVNEQNLPYRTGITNTDKAIRDVRQDTMFRQDITKVIVVVTDGGSRSPGATMREAMLAREEGFYVYVVGVGQYLDESEWRAIATDPDYDFVFNITAFRGLETVRDILPGRACALPPIIVGSCTIRDPADVYYVATDSASRDAIILIKNFEQRTTDFDSQLRVSYVMDTCDTDRAQNILIGNVDNVCGPQFRSRTFSTYETLLTRAQNLIRSSFRPNSKKVVVIVAGGDIQFNANRRELELVISSLRENLVEIVTVDLTRGFGPEILNTNSIYFPTGSVDNQRALQKDVLVRTCEAIHNRNDAGGFNPRIN